MKVCSKCGIEKELSQFNMKWHSTHCKSCKIEASKEWYKRNRERALLNNMKYQNSATPQQISEFYEDCKAQENRCAICNEIGLYKGKPKLMYDHDHETKLYRGAICFDCNTMLARAHDQMYILQRAIEYLQGSKM